MANSNLLLKIPSMAIGATGLAVSAYNIVKDGNTIATCETKDELGEDYLDMYAKNLSSSRESHLLEKIKHYAEERRLNNSIYPIVIDAKNHVTCWAEEIIKNIVPISLSVLALTAPALVKKYKTNQIMPMINNSLVKIDNFVGKMSGNLQKSNITGKIFDFAKKIPKSIKNQSAETIVAATAAGLLLVGTGKILIYDVLGIGKTKEY